MSRHHRSIFLASLALLVAATSTASSRDRAGPARQVLGTAADDAPGDGLHFVDELRKGGPVTIVTLGTSLTGGRWRWPDVLIGEWLDGEFPGQLRLVNLGVGASASEYVPGKMNPPWHEGKCGLDRMREVAAHEPDAVFVEFAVNDAYEEYGIPLDRSVANLRTILTHLGETCPLADVVLVTTNPVEGESERTRPALADYLRCHRELAVRLGLPVLDLYPHWQRLLREDPARFDALVPDGLHPVLAGYREVALPVFRDFVQRPANGLPVEVAQLLARSGASLELRVCRYDEARTVGQAVLRPGSGRAFDTAWTCGLDVHQRGEDFVEFSIGMTLEQGALPSAGVAVAFEFAGWDPGNYVLLPAAVYGGNRYVITDRGYAKGIDPEYLRRRDVPRMSVPTPHLSVEDGVASRLEVSACNLSTPAICIWDKNRKMGFILLSEQGTARGGDVVDHGFVVEESPDRRRATFIVSAPGVRERRPLFVGFGPSPDRGLDLAAGDALRLRLRLYAFPAAGIPDLLERFMRERKALTGPNRPRDLLPLSKTLEWMAQRIDARWHEGEVNAFYAPENAPWICFGWVGGLINTYPMLALGDAERLERVTRTIDFALARGQGESGYFHGTLLHDGSLKVRHPYPDQPGLVLTRKNADVLYWMVKQFMLLEAQGRGEAIKPTWEAGIRRLAEAFVATWRAEGQWGKMLDARTGEVAEFGTCGGVMAIGGLALASRWFGEPDYLEIARRAATTYFDSEFVIRGYTDGACGDIVHNADSESAAGFMTALMTLYEVSGERGWLEKSRQLAHLVATWTTSYDYVLPQATELRQLDARLAGVVWASTQNKHGAPGICNQSGDALFKLTRATGELLYAELLRDIVHAHAESIRPGGFTNERLTYCDAEHRGYRGDHVTGWCETNGALMAVELPGVYLRRDADVLIVFDHVQATREGSLLTLRNPTPYAATVRLLVEDAAESAEPLGENAFLTWPQVSVPAGGVLRVDVDRLPRPGR